MVRQAEITVQRGTGVPDAINCGLALFYLGVNLLEFFLLPLLLLPRDPRWGWLLLPLALLTNPFWSLIHEAIHDLLHSARSVNLVIGRMWLDLPKGFDAQTGRYHGSYFTTALQQMRGPIALQDLPQGAPVLRVRPYL